MQPAAEPEWVAEPEKKRELKPLPLRLVSMRRALRRVAETRRMSLREELEAKVRRQTMQPVTRRGSLIPERNEV